VKSADLGETKDSVHQSVHRVKSKTPNYLFNR